MKMKRNFKVEREERGDTYGPIAPKEPTVWLTLDCPRCTTKHKFYFRELLNPVDNFGWWAICSVTQQPLMMMLTVEECIGALAPIPELVLSR